MTRAITVLTTTMEPGNASNISLGVFDRHTLAQFMAIFCPVALAVDRSLSPIIYIIGICANSLAARIWTEKRMRSNNSSAVYLSTLSLTDLLFLLLHIMQELRFSWDVPTLNYHGICQTYFVFSMAAQYLSPLLVLGFTVERYIAVCHPFKKETYCTTSRAIRVVIGLIIMSFVLSSMQAYFWVIDDTGVCNYRTAKTFMKVWEIWTWTTEMLIFLIVPVIILIFNILVIREVRRMSKTGQIALPGQIKSNKGSSRATTVMLMSVSFYMIFTTLPATIVYAMGVQFNYGEMKMTDEQVFLDDTWTKYRYYLTGRKIVEEICLSHYACNFFLYLITGEHFRKCFLDIIRCTSKHKSNSFKSNGNYSEISQTQKAWQNTHLTHLSRL